MAQCPQSPDGYHYANFPPNGLCRYCGQGMFHFLSFLGGALSGLVRRR